MKTLLLVWLLMAAGCLAADLETLDGQLYKGAEIQVMDAYTVKVTHDAGIATGPLASLRDEDAARYAPRVDRSKDGRWWFERSQALYQGWRKTAGPMTGLAQASADKLAELMKPMEAHRAEITAYVVELAKQRHAQEAKLAKADEEKRAALRAQMLATMEMAGTFSRYPPESIGGILQLQAIEKAVDEQMKRK